MSKMSSTPSKAYVPPSLRKAADPPKAELESDDLKSKELFPSLQSTGSAAQRPGTTWARLRERLAPVPEKPSENQFAALDDDDKPGTPSAQQPLNFKTTIDAAIKREAAAREAAELQAATDDPLEMTAQQLAQNGWASLPAKVTKEYRQTLAERLAAAEARAAATQRLFRDEPFDTVGIPRSVLDSENPHDIFVNCMGAEAAGPDPWLVMKAREDKLYAGTSTAESEAAARQKLLKFRPRRLPPVA